MLNFFVPTFQKLALSVFNGLTMWVYGQVESNIAPRVVLKLKPELYDFVMSDVAPSMANAVMPNMEKLMLMGKYIDTTTIILSVVMAYLLACIFILFVESKKSNHAIKADEK
jgi:hypothetical protein